MSLTRRDALGAGAAAFATGASVFGPGPERPAGVARPEDFGAVADGQTDCTAAIQSAIDAIAAAGGGTVQFSPGSYALSAAPRRDRGGNAVVALPNTGAGTIRLQGNGATLITASSGEYAPDAGTPSLIGGPTPEQLGHTAGFSLWTVEACDLNLQLPADPQLSGIDLSRVINCYVDNCVVGTLTPNAVRPTTPWSFGLRLPDGQNFAHVIADRVSVYGLYAGLVLNTAHNTVRHAVVKWCNAGLCLTGSGEFAANDPHGSRFEYVSTQACVLHLCGWTPTGGAGSLPPDRPFRFTVGLWDIEDAAPGEWSDTFAHVLDEHDQIGALGSYLRVQALVGRKHGLRGGGPSLRLADLGAL